MKSTLRTFFLMVLLTVLFVWVGGLLGGRQGAITAFFMAAVISQNQKSELFIHGKDGSIQSQDSHGKDSRRSKG